MLHRRVLKPIRCRSRPSLPIDQEPEQIPALSRPFRAALSAVSRPKRLPVMSRAGLPIFVPNVSIYPIEDWQFRPAIPRFYGSGTAGIHGLWHSCPVLQKLIRLKDSHGYLGIDKNSFKRNVRPHLAEARVGRAVLFSINDLDRWAGSVLVPPVDSRRTKCDQTEKSPACESETEFGTPIKSSTSAAAVSRFKRVCKLVTSGQQRQSC